MSEGHKLSRVAILAVFTLSGILGFGVAQALPSSPSKGPLPIEAIPPGQPMIESLVPDYIAVLGSDGNIAGYIDALAMLDPLHGESLEGKISVYDESLTSVVGHMIDGFGFVALEEDISLREPIKGFVIEER